MLFRSPINKIIWTPFKLFYILVRLHFKLIKHDMSSYLVAFAHMPCDDCYLYFLPVLFNSPVDHELGGDHQYFDDQIPYPAEEGKRSPTSLIPVFKVFYLHAIQIYFAAPIVACGNCLNSFPLLLA